MRFLYFVRSPASPPPSQDPAAVQIKDRLLELEANLQQKRNTMKLGYVHPTTGEFTQASSVQLATTMRTHADEAVRKAGYEGLCSVGEFVAEDLVRSGAGGTGDCRVVVDCLPRSERVHIFDISSIMFPPVGAAPRVLTQWCDNQL